MFFSIFESLCVYGTLLMIMVLCCVRASKRVPGYVGYSGEYYQSNKFFYPEIVLCIISFAFVFGCRYGVGVDYFHYLYAYNYGTEREFEFLFQSVSDLMSNAGLHYALFFGFWAFLQIVILLYAFRKYRFLLPWIVFFLFTGNYFMSMMNIIRQQIACVIFLYALQFIDEKKLFKYLLCVAIACLFHRSSIILVVIYPLLRWKDDWFQRINVQLILFVAAVIISYLPGLVERWIERPFLFMSQNLGFENYRLGVLSIDSLNDMSRFGANTGFGIFVNFAKYLPVILYSVKLKQYYNSSFFNMVYSLWFISVLSGFMFGHSIILNRPFVFFSDFGIFIAAAFVYYCFKNKSGWNQPLAVAFIIVYLFMFVWIIAHGDLNTSTFTFFWQNSSI